MATDVAKLAEQLNDFAPATRRQALDALAATPAPAAPAGPEHHNLHCHTFFSYNGYGASPSRIAWECRQRGWFGAAICDFDVLDGLAEFHEACDVLGVRGAVHLETRVFFKEYAAHEINSPGEPGVYYFMGAGFAQPPAAGTPAAAQLDRLRAGAAARTRDIVARVNAALGTLQLDYARDVLPLTPAGNATERHVCTAYYTRSRAAYPDAAAWAAFWTGPLKTPVEKLVALADRAMDFNDLCRSKLMKAGGPGYVKPTPDTFPPLADVIAFARACGAIPMATWLDGMASGEADIASQLECLRAQGVAALNIIPDRNWNFKDPAEAARKIAKYHECVAVADRLQLPVNVGTELNKYGQRWVDDFTAAPMRAVAPSLERGARVMIGHAWLHRFAGYSYIGAAADADFGADVGKRNAFFASVGALPPPPPPVLAKLRASPPAANLSLLRRAARQGAW